MSAETVTLDSFINTVQRSSSYLCISNEMTVILSDKIRSMSSIVTSTLLSNSIISTIILILIPIIAEG